MTFYQPLLHQARTKSDCYNNPINKIIKVKFVGLVIGMGVIASLFYPALFILPALTIFFAVKSNFSKLRLFLFMVSLLLIIWILIKSLLMGSLGYGFIVAVFPLFLFAMLSIKKISKPLLEGVYSPVAILFFMDVMFNLSAMFLGADLLGRVPSIRADGTRYGGVMGHSFFSIAISVSFILLAIFLNRSKFSKSIGVINLLLSGSMRAYIYLFCYVVFSALLIKKQCLTQILGAVLIVATVVGMTFLSVYLGWVNEMSGNAFRLFAWGNAVSAISESPLWGAWHQFAAWDPDVGVTIENIVETGTTESAILGDVLSWGLFFVVGKLLIVFTIWKSVEQKVYKKSIDNKNLLFAFLPFGILVDYCVGSLWGNMLSAFIATMIAVYGITNVNTHSYIQPQNFKGFA